MAGLFLLAGEVEKEEAAGCKGALAQAEKEAECRHVPEKEAAAGCSGALAQEDKEAEAEIEELALKKESDAASKERLTKLQQELADEREKLGELKARWVNEKKAIDDVQGVKEELERLRNEAEIAERDGDYEKASELRYGRIPDLEGQLKDAEAKAADHAGQETMLTEEVSPDTIADVVSAWTGIPAGKICLLYTSPSPRD